MKKIVFMIATILTIGSFASAAPRQIPGDQMQTYKTFIQAALSNLYTNTPDSSCSPSSYRAATEALSYASQIIVDDSGREPSIIVIEAPATPSEGAQRTVLSITTSADQQRIASYTVQTSTYRLGNSGTLVDINAAMQWVASSPMTCTPQ